MPECFLKAFWRVVNIFSDHIVIQSEKPLWNQQTLVMRYQQMKQMASYGGFKGFGKGKAPA